MELDNKPSPMPEVFTPEQLAEYLQLPLEVVLAGLERREIPAQRIGGYWRVRRVLLEQWLDNEALTSAGSQENPILSFKPASKDTSQATEAIDEITTIQGDPLSEPTAEAIIGFSESSSVSLPQNESSQKVQTGASEETTALVRFDSDLPPSSQRFEGTVKHYNLDQGYGKIEADDGRELVIHAGDIEGYGQSLRPYYRVTFEAKWSEKGWRAYDVVITSKTNPRPSKSTPRPSAPAKLVHPTNKGSIVSYERALAARELKDYKRARELFEEAIRKGPFLNIFQAYSAMEQKENPENAMRVLEKGIKYFPDAGILYNDYAMLKRRLKDPDGALDVLRRGLTSTSPEFARQLHWSLAVILVERDYEEDLAEAAEHAQRAKELGQDLRNDFRYVKLQVLTGPSIGRKTYRFFASLGFEVKPHSYSARFADLLIQPSSSEYVETYDLHSRILVRCFYSSVAPTSLNELQSVLRNPPASFRGVNQDIAFIVAEDIGPLRDILYRLMSDNREAIVPVDTTTLTAANNGQSPVPALRPVLDQWLSRRDLYKFNYPVYGRRFFGRELDLQRLMRDLDDGHNVGVFGLRKVGKTSLLMQLRELRQQDIVIYFDLQGVPSGIQDCAYIYWAIARKLKEEVERKKDAVHGFGKLVFQLGNQDVAQFQKRTPRLFDHDIHAVLGLLEQQNSSTRLIVILDEVDRLLPAPGYTKGFQGYPDFFAYLRGTSQNSNGRFVTIITAANPALCEQAVWEGRDNPIFQFYHQMFLPPLALEDCKEMIEKLGRGMGIGYDEASLEILFDATSGHPYITRLLCSRIGEITTERPLQVTYEVAKQARNDFLRSDATPIFNEILERLDTFFPIERDLLLFIADGVDSEKELSGLVNEPVDIALYHLDGYHLVERIDGRYRIKIDLLREWLRKHRLGRIQEV